MSEEAAAAAPEFTVSTGGLVVAATAAGILVAVVVRTVMKSISKSTPEPEAGEPTAPKAQTTTPGLVTQSELSAANGEDGKPVFVAVQDPFSGSVTVFDMSSGSGFYGPGGPYHLFAGKNATHGLAKSSTDPSKVTGDLSTLTESEKDTQVQWYQKFSSKYPIVGNLVSDDANVNEDATSTLTTESKKDA